MSDVCALCRQTARQAIHQSCCHVLCFECGCAIKRQEIDQCYNLAQFKINCPICTQTIVFSDIHSLVIQEKSNLSSSQKKSPLDQPANSCNSNSKKISEYSKYKNLQQFSALDFFTREDQKNWFEPTYLKDFRTPKEPHSQEDRLGEQCRQQNATPICSESCQVMQEVNLDRSPQLQNCSRINEVTECKISCEENNNPETIKEIPFSYTNCNSSPHYHNTEASDGVFQERDAEINRLLPKQENHECETENQKKQREFVEEKYSYFTHDTILSKIERLQKGLEKGLPLKCEQHGEFATLYDTTTHEIKCPICVFEEDCKMRSQISEGCGQPENLYFLQQSGFSRVAPAKVCQENMKKDIHDWECFLEKKMCQFEKNIQNAVLSQGVLRENFVEETRVLKQSFDELRQRLQTREIELSESLSKRYAEESEHLKRISEELLPLRDKLRMTLRHFMKNLSLDEQMNLSYYHVQLNEIRKIICQLKRKSLQIYDKCSSQILSLDLKEHLSSYLGIFGRVDSFVLKGFENRQSENPSQSLKTRSAGHSIDRLEEKCPVASVNPNSGSVQRNQEVQLQMKEKCCESKLLRQSQIAKSDYNKNLDDIHCFKAQQSHCESQIIQTPFSMTPRNSCKFSSITGPVTGFNDLPQGKMEQKCPSNLDFCGVTKSPASYVSKQDCSSRSLIGKESSHKNSLFNSQLKSRIDKNEEYQKKPQVHCQRV